jgi:hypothetical protein
MSRSNTSTAPVLGGILDESYDQTMKCPGFDTLSDELLGRYRNELRVEQDVSTLLHH